MSGCSSADAPPVTVRAPAKLNLTLEVVARREDGYHDLRSVFARLEGPCDIVTLAWREDPRITVACDVTAVPSDDANICSRAARAYLSRAGAIGGAAIHIRKRIPLAAGLGGGSSDAAAVLLALNARFGVFDAATLAAMGADIGKDVPFFLSGAALARVSGLGEEITPLPEGIGAHFLLVNPGIAVPTPAAYAALDRHVRFIADPRRRDATARMCRALSARDLDCIAGALYNDFELPIEREHPLIAELRHALLAFGAKGAAMSGSGATVFGVFADAAEAAAARDALRTHYPGAWLEVARPSHPRSV